MCQIRPKLKHMNMCASCAAGRHTQGSALNTLKFPGAKRDEPTGAFGRAMLHYMGVCVCTMAPGAMEAAFRYVRIS